MLPDRVSNPGPLTYESGVLPIALRGPALEERICSHRSTLFHVIVEPILEGSSIQESKQEVAL